MEEQWSPDEVILLWKAMGIKDFLRIACAVLVDFIVLHAVLQEVWVLEVAKAAQAGRYGDSTLCLFLNVI